MNIVLIEDERLLAEELEQYICSIRKDWKVIKVVASIKEAVAYFSSNDNHELVFSDIQLGDGLSFDIFKQVSLNAPVIFCTAYNQYAIEAFKNNGIEYILKPFNRASIEEAIGHYESLKTAMKTTLPEYDRIMELLQHPKAEKQPASLLVTHRDKIIPIKTTEIALFYIHNGLICLMDFCNNSFIINHTLDELEITVGNLFFRVDRQHLVNRTAIKDVSQYFSRKLLLNLTISFPEAITIRKEKTAEFLKWLQQS